jgi:hypothetical protein
MARAGVGKLAKITIQSAAQVDVPNTLQEITSSSALFDWRNWLFGFGWASSGALVAASIFMLLSVPSVEHQAQPGRVAADNPFNASFVKGIELPVQNQKESLEKLANQDLARSKAVELNKMAVVIPQESSATHPDVLIVE